MKKLFLSFIFISILGAFVYTTYFLYQKSQEPPVVFETTQPFYTDITRKTVATGHIVPRKEIAVKSKVSGVVESVYVEAGDAIKEGELIAKIKLIPNMEYLSRAESELEKAKINFANAKRELARQRALFEDKLIPEFEYNKFLLQFDLSKEAVSAAENNVALIKDGASKESGKVSNLIAATTSGIVLDVPVKEGSFVIESNTFNAGTSIALIANMQDMIFEGRVDEAEVGKLKEGMPLKLKVGALDDVSFDATLEYISPKGWSDQGTIKFSIKAAVSLDNNYFLRAGYSANADIVLEEKNNVLAINEGNLIIEDDKTYVEIETGEQQFEKREVKTGLSDGINIEIIQGLSENTILKKL